MAREHEIERWTGPANIAWCEKHGLHGARSRCFECDEPVEQIPMVPIADLLDGPAVAAAARVLDRSYSRHQLTLEQVATAVLEAAIETLPPPPPSNPMMGSERFGIPRGMALLARPRRRWRPAADLGWWLLLAILAGAIGVLLAGLLGEVRP